MNNHSWRYPFGALNDEQFDKNKDGELDELETFFRDMQIDEMNVKAAQYASEREHQNKHPQPKGTGLFGGIQIIAILLSNVILIGGLILLIVAPIHAFFKLILCVVMVIVAIGILKAVDLF